jgi:hypothetical protein
LCYREEWLMEKSSKRIHAAANTRAATDRSKRVNRFREVLTIAKEKGLLEGARTELVRGRMPKALVAKARARSGVQSDTKLIEVALANLALADDYPAWLLAQHGTVSKEVDLEF